MARPKIEINFKEFERLCALQCTLAEIAGWFGCSEDTIERRVLEEYEEGFAEVFSKKRGKGKISLRRWQMQCAERGNASMLIFLGKNYLGQKDIQEITTSQPIKLQYSLDEPEHETLDVTPDEKQIEPTEEN